MTVIPGSIIRFRKRHNWSQDELAIAAGLNLRTVQRIENEGSASLASLKALAAALDVTFEDIANHAGNRGPHHEYQTMTLPFKSGILNVSAPDLQFVLNRESQQGWQFKQMVVSTNNSGGSHSIIAVFERAVFAR